MLRDAGANAAAVVALAGAVALMARSRPWRWLWRRLVADPVTTWFRAEVERAVEGCMAPLHEQMRPNGGTSLRDRVDAIEAKIDSWSP